MPGTLKITPLIEALERAGVVYELLEHPRTERAADEAEALGLSLHEVAKTLVLSTLDGNVRVVLPASERLDLHKLRDFVGGGKDTHLLTEEEMVREYPQFELGAVPPVGGPKDRVILDRRLAGLRHVRDRGGCARPLGAPAPAGADRRAPTSSSRTSALDGMRLTGRRRASPRQRAVRISRERNPTPIARRSAGR